MPVHHQIEDTIDEYMSKVSIDDKKMLFQSGHKAGTARAPGEPIQSLGSGAREHRRICLSIRPRSSRVSSNGTRAVTRTSRWYTGRTAAILSQVYVGLVGKKTVPLLAGSSQTVTIAPPAALRGTT